ncbi:hypothetical protein CAUPRSCDRAFT_12441 [Caulochytrium protostelioides]|uniref:Uncharacterized protein n=1 Tax=Caulochytrium protostelioides TaxID=1555241 RepID=A0A4P9WRQ4_9FUNG|nr:hypothetical protein CAUPRSCDRAFT_12441 [Caulochytrium protostelioides]
MEDSKGSDCGLGDGEWDDDGVCRLRRLSRGVLARRRALRLKFTNRLVTLGNGGLELTNGPVAGRDGGLEDLRLGGARLPEARELGGRLEEMPPTRPQHGEFLFACRGFSQRRKLLAMRHRRRRRCRERVMAHVRAGSRTMRIASIRPCQGMTRRLGAARVP